MNSTEQTKSIHMSSQEVSNLRTEFGDGRQEFRKKPINDA